MRPADTPPPHHTLPVAPASAETAASTAATLPPSANAGATTGHASLHIVEFSGDSLRFADAVPTQLPAQGFVWIYLPRQQLDACLPLLQQAALQLGGSQLLDLHCSDLRNASHPSHYDYTSVYDLVVFRRLATQAEAQAEPGTGEVPADSAQSHAAMAPDPSTRTRRAKPPPAFRRIATRAVGFAIFDRLLISVHPEGCASASSFIERFLADARHSVDATAARNRIPTGPADLMLRMVNAMVDGYLELRRDLTAQLEHWQAQLLRTDTHFHNWGALMAARSQLHLIEDLCDEQHDAMQEWLDTLRVQPPSQLPGSDLASAQAQHDQLMARARDVIEHIARVVHHVRRLEQSAETVVQIHFSVQGHRTNDIMRTLTAITAIFLPLNLITGFFGMNFENFPLIHTPNGLWWTMLGMVGIAMALGLVFWRKRYLARTRG